MTKKTEKPEPSPFRDVSNAPLAHGVQGREIKPKYETPQSELEQLDTRPPEERELPKRVPGPYAADLDPKRRAR